MFIQPKSPKITGIVSFTVLSTLSFIALAISLQDYSFWPDFSLQIILTLFIYLAHRSTHYHPALLWALSIWGALHLAGGTVTLITTNGPQALNHQTFFHSSLSFLNAIHVYGFIVLTWFNWQTLCNVIHSRYQRRLLPNFGLLLLVIMSAIGYYACYILILVSLPPWVPKFSELTLHGILQGATTSALGALLASAIIKLRSI